MPLIQACPPNCITVITLVCVQQSWHQHLCQPRVFLSLSRLRYQITNCWTYSSDTECCRRDYVALGTVATWILITLSSHSNVIRRRRGKKTSLLAWKFFRSKKWHLSVAHEVKCISVCNWPGFFCTWHLPRNGT